MKKLISILLVILLVCGTVFSAFAEDTLPNEAVTEEKEKAETQQTEENSVEENEQTVEEASKEIEQTKAEPTVFEEAVILSEDMEISSENSAIFKASVEVPKGMTLKISGDVQFCAKTDVYGCLTVEENATLAVMEDAEVTFHTEEDEDGKIVFASELINKGELSVAGTLILEKGVVFADTNNAMLLIGEGKIEGTKHIAGNVSDEKAPLTKKEFEALICDGVIETDAAYELTEDITVRKNSVLIIKSGEFSVPEGHKLTVNGALIIEGGSVNIDKGASLENNFFIQVSKNGRLVVDKEAKYNPSDNSGIVWDQTEDNSTAVISGIMRKWIDCSVIASSVYEFIQAVQGYGYHTLNVYINNPDYITAVELPDDVTVCMK